MGNRGQKDRQSDGGARKKSLLRRGWLLSGHPTLQGVAEAGRLQREQRNRRSDAKFKKFISSKKSKYFVW